MDETIPDSPLLNLYLISQDQNSDSDTYDAAVVAAPNADIARNMHPRDGRPIGTQDRDWRSWADGPEHVTVTYLGIADEGITQQVILASYNAG